MTDTNRKLATIIALDVAGFSARTEADEARTIAQIANLRPVIEGIAKAHGGRVFNTAGDGFMLEFASALSGVNAALELADECRPRVRVGVHVGEVSVQPNGDLLGHGVNVAARLMAKAEPGTALISGDVCRMIRGPLAERFVSRGPVQLDKMNETIEIFAPAHGNGAAIPSRPKTAAKQPAAFPLSLDRRTLMIGGGTAAAGVAAFALWQLTRTPTNPSTTPSLAVLPFSNLTGKTDDLAFAAGLHDDLLTRLASVSALRVVARTSVMRFLNTTKSASEVASELGVNAVLMGSVQRSGDQVRVAVQLIDGATDSQRWGESFDRALTVANLFGIQREITEAIARALNTVLAARELDAAFEGGTQNLKAYELYANVRLSLRSSDPARVRQPTEALDALDRAIALDPSFAAAYALKGYVLTQSYWFNGRTDTRIRDAAKMAIDRAQALAPDAAETQISLAVFFYQGFLDYRRAMEHVDRALLAAPNSEIAWYMKANIARRDGRFEDSVAAFDRAIALDPQNPVFLIQFVGILTSTGQFARAASVIERARAVDPASLMVRLIAAMSKLAVGDVKGAWVEAKDLRSFRQSVRVAIAITTRDPVNIKFSLEDWPAEAREPNGFPEYEVYHGAALAALGREEEARRILKAVKARLEASEDPYPGGWATNASVSPMTLPGLLGDLEGVRAAERDFLKNAPRDELRKYDLYIGFSIAFLGAGDRERAAHYLDEAVKSSGPWRYLEISVNPWFDALRDHPRYKALKASYDTWAAANPKDAPRR